jgi:polyribonucleotide nucleotidyltransferase
MFQIHKKEIDFAGRLLKIETGKIARHADGAVMVSYGDSQILCTVVGAKTAKEGTDFFALSVHYLEKMYAAGKIPGGYFKRETKPSDAEVLNSRLIDRPIRPLFPDGFHNEVQIVCMVVSSDNDADLAIAALIGASAALSISGLPFQGPVAAARVGYIDGEYVVNPSPKDLLKSKLDLVVAGTKEGVLMVESEAHELSEDIMLGAIKFGHASFQPIINMIESLQAEAGKPLWELDKTHDIKEELKKKCIDVAQKSLIDAYNINGKKDRLEAIKNAKKMAIDQIVAENHQEGHHHIDHILLNGALKAVESDILRQDILKNAKRLDGRKLDQVRPILAETSILNRAHGSSLFTRGETQALVSITLGNTQDEQKGDNLSGDFSERFMLNYNFPPYSVGECGRIGAPGRREVGHGKLAWRALNPMLPSRLEFSFAIRAVSEITESNGSSSMATVCGTSLALMDAGVPLKKPVSGIAMGLIKEGNDYAILSDILGDEDYLGDMDFKVAGTRDGITALQMDIKITSITYEIMQKALKQAQEGRSHILDEMAKALDKPKNELSPFAPRMVTVQINKDKIRDLIGPGGKMIREICEVTESKIDINDEGLVTIMSPDQAHLDRAYSMVAGIGIDPEIGSVHDGKVVKILDFGAFVAFSGGREGMVHISELKNERVKQVSDVVNEGDSVKVKVIAIEGNKIRLSMKAVEAN